MLRRVVGIGGALILLLLLGFGVKSCRDARSEQAYKDYNRDVAALVQESEDEASGLFDLLEKGGQTPVELQNAVNGYASSAAQLVDRARDTDHPDDLEPAHRYLVETLEFRRDGLRGIAGALPRALGDRGEEATNQIAAQMQFFLASDVVYSQRFYPQLQERLRAENLLDTEKPPRSSFMKHGDIEWLVPTTVADRIQRIASGEGGGGGGAVEPGLHGTGLGTVTVQPGGQVLAEGGAAEIKAAPNLSLEVQVANQGEHDEQNVTVRVTITGAGEPIELEEKLAEIAAGETKTVAVPLSRTPPAGQPVEIRVEIRPVPGEEKTDNNRATFPAVFTN